MKSAFFLICIIFCTFPLVAIGEEANTKYETRQECPLPILNIKPSQGQAALLAYNLTEKEKMVFQDMDKASSPVPESQNPEQDLENVYKVIVPIGAKYGLDRNQSIAFWTRVTFSLFERDEYRPQCGN